MKNVNKPTDSKAAEIKFGIETETQIPLTSAIEVGGYHSGRPVISGRDAVTGELIEAPTFNGQHWRADNDGSIVFQSGYRACEFVSPILHGEAGLQALRAFLKFAKRIGAKVNNSCGCHITVGVVSVIGTSETTAIAKFIRKFARFATNQSWAIYAQTGTGRHENRFSHTLRPEFGPLFEEMDSCTDTTRLAQLACAAGRGMVNFQKAFRGEASAIEFRAFAGTMNEAKILHHLATALGLMRKAHVAGAIPSFVKSAKRVKVSSAPEAVKRLWRVLGWVDGTSTVDCALGLFGALHNEFGKYRKVAMTMAEKFETQFPAANL